LSPFRLGGVTPLRYQVTGDESRFFVTGCRILVARLGPLESEI
jgi:hypothetical protein